MTTETQTTKTGKKRGPKPKNQSAAQTSAAEEATPKTEGIESERPAIEGPGQAEPQTVTLPEASEGEPIKFAQPEIAQSDVWKYHPEIQPRIFRKGEVIPAGWLGPEGIAGKIWTMDACGNWKKVTEEKPK